MSTDPARLDIDRIHRFLSAAYWSTGIPRDVVQRSIAHSLPFGLYAPSGEQAGFARVVTDLATADAHSLYARHGFRPPANPEIHLFIEQAPADLWPHRDY